MASWLDDLLGKQIQDDGTNVPQRKKLNLVGFVVEDDDASGATKVTSGGASGFGGAKISVAAQSNSGSTAYPAAAAQAIGLSTFIRTAAADHDSIRFPAVADDIIPLTTGLQGRVSNNTDKIVDLYPPVGQQIAVDGASLGDAVPIEVPPGGSVFWMLDLDGTWFCA